MRRFVFAAMLLLPAPAQAGAWTLSEDHVQIITQETWSTAIASFDDTGTASIPAGYEKWLTSIDAEYGWNDWLTLIAAPEFAHARTLDPSGAVITANDFAAAAGARVRLYNDFGVVSAELTAKSAGAFAMSVSRGRAAGQEIEIRGLYGTNFTFFHRDGYADVEAGYRWIAGPRADEIPIDISVGMQITKKDSILIQSFNIITANNARPPYTYYRSHKLQISSIRRISDHVSLQSGAFVSPAGQNALLERGINVALWVNF